MSQAWSAESPPLSIGVDIVEVDAVGRLCSRGMRRLGRVFTPAELGGCRASGHPRARIERLACIFAAKEAVFKALGRGWGQGMRWNEVCVVRLARGGLAARLGGNAKKRLRELGGSGISISAAAVRGHAMACAVAHKIPNPKSQVPH